jgi:predicted dienelactone hydrolase
MHYPGLLTALFVVLTACGTTPATTSQAGDTGAGDTQASDGDASEVDSTGSDAGPLTWPVDQPGPFHCGYRTLPLTYTPPGGLPSRTIEVHLWYPASAATANHPKYLDIFDDATASTDAPLAPSAYASGYPVLIHSHGYKGFAGNSATLMCYVASHGWVAVAPEHAGNTLLDTPDADLLATWLERALDIRKTLDHFTKMPTSDPLAGKLDLEHVGMSGHSRGSFTTWAIAGATQDPAVVEKGCQDGRFPDCTAALQAAFAQPLGDPRIKTVVVMAGSGDDFWGDHGREAVKIPVLQMNGTLDDAGETALFASIQGVDLTWVQIAGGCHQLFGLGNHYLGDPACAQLPDAEGFALVQPWLLAWLRYHVLGDRSAQVSGIVTGTLSLSPKVAFHKK